MTTAPTRRGLDRCDWLMLVVLALTFAWMLYRTPVIWALVGFSTDDGTYLATAKSLAEGRGYRHANLPGEPLQTKYPPLYPLALAILWRVFPSFPHNLRYVVFLHAGLATAAAWLSYRLIRDRWGGSPWLAVAGITVAVTNPHWWTLVQVPMTEIPYAALSLGALLLAWAAAADATRVPAEPARGAPRPAGTVSAAALAGLLAAAANLTRSIGLAVVLALLIFLALRRRWRGFTCAAIVAAVPLVLWGIWRAGARAANAADSAAAAFVYDLDYSAWLPRDLAGWAWVAYLNLGRLLAGVALRLVLLPESAVLTGLTASAPAVAATWLAFGITIALVFLGFVRAARNGEVLSPLYVLVYWALLCLWPGASESARRFQVPLLPLLAPALLYGAHLATTLIVGAGRVGRRAIHGSGNVADATARAAALVVAAGLVFANLYVATTMARTLANSPRAAQREELIGYVRERLPANAILAADSTGYLHLRTGRKVILPAPMPRVLPIAYPADSQFTDAGLPLRPLAIAAFRGLMREELLLYYQRSGATHLVLGERGGPAAFVHEFVTKDPAAAGRFQLRDAVGPYEIYEVVGRPAVGP